MQRLSLDLGERSYPILLGSGLLQAQDVLEPYLGREGVLVVTNETIAPLYLDEALKMMGGRKAGQLILPDGEQYKTLDTLNLIFNVSDIPSMSALKYF